jgi:hypothetical protein
MNGAPTFSPAIVLTQEEDTPLLVRGGAAREVTCAAATIRPENSARVRTHCPSRFRFLFSGRHVLGVCLLIVVAAIWVGASVLVQFIFSDANSTPWLFLTTVNVSEFSILLPIEALLVTWRRWRRNHTAQLVLIALPVPAVQVRDHHDSESN